MVMGFGCNVPALYATRTIENRPARILTGMMIPFMSCSARLPVYVIFGLAFFPRHASWVIWGLYLFGILLAVVIGMTLSRLVFKGQERAAPPPLPPYQRPQVRQLLGYAIDHSLHFIKNAATVILLVSVILWGLLHLPWGVQDHRQSLYGRMSAALAPTLEPAGFGEWRVAGSLLTGLVAKEMIISSLSQLYGGGQTATTTASGGFMADIREIAVGFGVAVIQAGKQVLEVLTPGVRLFSTSAPSRDTALTRALVGTYSPLAALAFLVFVLTYIPCVATITAQAQELGWKWTGVSVSIQTLLPWLLAVGVFQVGRLLGFG